MRRNACDWLHCGGIFDAAKENKLMSGDGLLTLCSGGREQTMEETVVHATVRGRRR
jgi:hypothetical protein